MRVRSRMDDQTIEQFDANFLTIDIPHYTGQKDEPERSATTKTTFYGR
jgi:hypothetical protein